MDISARRKFLASALGGVGAFLLGGLRAPKAEATDGTFDNLTVNATAQVNDTLGVAKTLGMGTNAQVIYARETAPDFNHRYVQINGGQAQPLSVNARGVSETTDDRNALEMGTRALYLKGSYMTATTVDPAAGQALIDLICTVWDPALGASRDVPLAIAAQPITERPGDGQFVIDVPNFGEAVRIRTPGVFWLNQAPGTVDGFVVNEDSWGRRANLNVDGVRFGPKGGPEDAGIARIAAKTVAVVGEGFQLGKVASLPSPSVTYRGQVLRVEGSPDKVYVCIKGTGSSYSWKQIA